MASSKRARVHCPALERTQLCKHGPRHRLPGCHFAHSLSELRCPDERVQLYPEAWCRVDRFYGQALSQDQLERFQLYWSAAEWWNLPAWAIALHLLEAHQECYRGMAYPWDFGLLQEQTMICLLRGRFELPFEPYPSFLDRLMQRRHVMIDFGPEGFPLWSLSFRGAEEPLRSRSISCQDEAADEDGS